MYCVYTSHDETSLLVPRDLVHGQYGNPLSQQQ